MAWLRRVRDDRVRRRLLREEDAREDIVDEVHHHWVVYTLPTLELAVVVALVWFTLVSSAQVGWFFMLVALVLLLHAVWKSLVRFMDVFVVTNMRVFRVTGVVSSKHATTPLARILDITVDQPFLGLMLGYGHFTFESAAQEQGLRDITYVGRPLARDLTIQRHVQQSGLRGPRPMHNPP
ncbi:MAG: PH domain-containing protein [Nocardioidaceae bacterium]|nr:PH domain-containing protein [Nocardioidaceae bacterium]